MVELGLPLFAESAPPVFETAPVVEAAPVLAEYVQPAHHVVEYVTPAPVDQIVDHPIPPLFFVIKMMKEGIERNEKQIAALSRTHSLRGQTQVANRDGATTSNTAIYKG